MVENRTIRLAEIPIGGKGGFIWNRLHGEREDICETLLRSSEPQSQAQQRQRFLQARLRRIDDALDRLMSGSYGVCSRCGGPIEETTLDIDSASTLCLDCWGHQLNAGNVGASVSQQREDDSDGEVRIDSLDSFDTILLRTLNSDYRILLLDPATGRALVEGGNHLVEPSEALVRGSAAPGAAFSAGTIGIGGRLEMWVNERAILTSPIKSIEVRHNAPPESASSISAALHTSSQ